MFLSIFFKILIFWVISGVKVQKMVPNDKTFCLSLQSQESYIIWLSFVVHLCEMMISSGIFLFFQNFGFLGCYEVKGQKMVQSEKKFCYAPYFKNHVSYDFHLWYTCVFKMITFMGIFPFFSKFLIFRVVRRVKEQKIVRNDKKFSLLYTIFEEP